MKGQPLEEYKKKRHFERTPEPAGEARPGLHASSFVVQKHAARRLHYDLRLESDGVMKSWAVPKGPSMNPRDKRLAVPTEDHPLSYADFEGNIPRGEYGAGTVQVWDRGLYVNLKRQGEDNSIARDIRDGHVEVLLEGEKLKGRFALTRVREGKDETWLLIKMRDKEASDDYNPVATLDTSVLSGRSLEDISANKGYLSAKPPDRRLNLDGREVKLTNLDKVLYPKTRFTKADVVNYYIAIAPYMLPHLRKRPLTLKRYPNGVKESYFYEKRCPPHHPDWLTTIKAGKTKPVNYCSVDDRASLVWVANLASLELHPMLSRVEDVERPTLVAFDLDPGPRIDVLDCAEVALNLRNILTRMGLESFIKTSGGKGLHLYIPLNTPAGFDESKEFSHAVSLLMKRFYPDKVVSNMRKVLREGKVLLDWSQNDDHKTTVCAYSLRAHERPYVSTPLSWKELETALQKRDAKLLQFEAEQVLERVRELGDLFAPVATLEQELPEIARTAKRPSIFPNES